MTDRTLAVNYVPKCLRNLPVQKRQRRALNKTERAQQAAIIEALRDVYRSIQQKVRDNPEWTHGYHSELTVVEARIKHEAERKP
jgi:ribosomal protein L9